MKKQKIYNLILFILIFIIIISNILIKPLNDLDELWNYNFARNIVDGLVPYKDFNMVITPLLSIVCGIILKLICNELIVMRVLAALLHSLIFYMIYKILNIVNIKKGIAIVFTFGIGYLFKDFYCIDYNYASLLLCLCIIYIEIKQYKKDEIFLKYNFTNDLIIGILCGLILATKQTIGVFMSIALLGNKLLFVRKKDDIKNYIKSFAYRILGIAIPTVSLLLYLLVNNAIGDFVSYTIKGVAGFTNYIPYTNLLHLNYIRELSILVPMAFIYSWIKTICFEKDKITYILLVYGLGMFVVCFPISDRIHFLIGAVPTIILILYEICYLLRNLLKRFIKESYLNFSIKILVYISFVLIFNLSCYSCINCYRFLKNTNYSTLNHWKYIPINNDLEQQITNVNKYISSQNEDVIILDTRAVIYMMPYDRYNKDYDMFNKGNFGEDGEERIIKEISNSENVQYLILKDKYLKNWQMPIDIIEFVKENKNKIGEIDIFDIYE